jgi:hypothetical protein
MTNKLASEFSHDDDPTDPTGARPMCVCYHGTDFETAAEILLNGFAPGTHFARHLEDAMSYGGTHVFEVAFMTLELTDNWQFVEVKAVPKERIVSLKRYAVQLVQEDKILRRMILDSNLTEEQRAANRRVGA